MVNVQDNGQTRSVGRRRFIQVLGGATAAAGLAACADDANDLLAAPNGQAASQPAAAAPAVDDRSVSIVPELTRLADLEVADDGPSMAYAPNVPPAVTRSDQRIVEFAIDVLEGECDIDPENGVKTLMWGFRIGGESDVTCGSPGPILRARVGDLARITVTNLAGNVNPHNIDFHAITGQGGGAADTTVAPGESATINARLLYPGAFMYHCAFGDVPMHIAHGMYGMFIVDPEEPLPAVDHEWSIMQSEWYVGEPGTDGIAEFDPEALTNENPRYVTFNGRTDALTGDNSLKMEVGQRARFFMVNEGLNLDSNFHPIGSQWDLVYPEAATHPINRVIRGSQSTLVVAGGGTVTELVGYVPCTIILVDHALVRTFYKGCIGLVEVAGEPNAIFSAGDEAFADAAAGEPASASPSEAAPGEVLIPAGAFDPANADNAYQPSPITVAAGTTVTWRNEDSVFHTVTSGQSSGTSGTPDGIFDSGEIQSGEVYTYTFDQPGTFDYYCTPHPWMIGQVIVT